MKRADTHRTSYTSNTRTRRQTALTTPLDTAGRHLIYTRARRQTSHRHAWYRCRCHLIYIRARDGGSFTAALCPSETDTART